MEQNKHWTREDLLKQQGYTVQVLEASDRIGGRVHSISDIADLPIEWGASVIKGQNHLLYALMKNNGAQFLSDEIQDYAIVNGYWTSKAAMAENPDQSNAWLQELMDRRPEVDKCADEVEP